MSESLIQHRAEVQGLTTAILLPSVSVFGDSVERVPGSPGPLTQVVGIGLSQRAVLTLHRAGIRQLIVLTGPEEDLLKQALSRGPRVTIPVLQGHCDGVDGFLFPHTCDSIQNLASIVNDYLGLKKPCYFFYHPKAPYRASSRDYYLKQLKELASGLEKQLRPLNLDG